MTGGDALVAVVSLALGYAIGSLPLSGIVGRAAGTPDGISVADAARTGSPTGPTAVWRLAGPGWGFLALVADLARGILPVTLAAATFSWGAGWAAGLGAVAGAIWPAGGRIPGGRGNGVLPTVVAGVLVALDAPLAVVVLVLALALLVGRRVLGRPSAAASERGTAPQVTLDSTAPRRDN